MVKVGSKEAKRFYSHGVGICKNARKAILSDTGAFLGFRVGSLSTSMLRHGGRRLK